MSNKTRILVIPYYYLILQNLVYIPCLLPERILLVNSNDKGFHTEKPRTSKLSKQLRKSEKNEQALRSLTAHKPREAAAVCRMLASRPS